MTHLRNLSTQVMILTWAFQEIDKLQDILFGLLTPCNIFKMDTDIVFNYPGLGFTYPKEASSPPATKSSCHRPLPCCKK